MEEKLMLASVGSAATPSDPSGERCELDQMGIHEPNNLKSLSDDSFVVDMSRITLQRTVSRKGQGRSAVEKKMNSTAASERDNGISSPRNTLEKSMVDTMGSIEQPPSSPHRITIVTAGNTTTSSCSSSSSTSMFTGRRNSFKRSSLPSNWSTDPRRILLFFATLSSMGTILLIYFTLSMGKLGRGGNGGDEAAA